MKPEAFILLILLIAVAVILEIRSMNREARKVLTESTALEGSSDDAQHES